MKSVLLGLVLLPVVAIALLSIRPGGLRRQIRFAARRLRIAIVLGGIYVVLSTVARVVLPEGGTLDYLLVGAAVVLGVTFVVLAQDPAAERR